MRATSLGHAGILIESGNSRILCDPWFVPAFFGSWFVFPRNDQLDIALVAKIESPTHLYISHIHGDHFDEAFLANHVTREATVLLPDFPSRELEQRLSRLGFTKFVKTENGKEKRNVVSVAKAPVSVLLPANDGYLHIPASARSWRRSVGN